MHKNELNPIGHTVTISSAIVGGYLGSQSSLIRINENGQPGVTNKPLNAAIGVVIGYGIASLGNHLLAKQGHFRTLENDQDVEKWVTNFDKKYIVLDKSNSFKEISLIPRDGYQSYVVKNFQDVNDFFKVFRSSPSNHKEDVIAQGITVSSRSQLPELLQLFPETKHKVEIANKYILSSPNIAELFAASLRFPNHTVNLEETSYQMIYNIQDASIFKNRFPNTPYKEKIVDKLYKSLRRSELPSLIDLFKDASNIKEAKKRYIMESTDVMSLVSGSKSYPGIFSFTDVEQMALNLLDEDVDEYKDFFLLFPGSKNTTEAVNRLNTYAISSLGKCIDEQDCIDFINKFSGTKTNPKLIENARQIRKEILDVFAKQYDESNRIQKGYRLVIIKFKYTNEKALTHLMNRIIKDVLSLKSTVPTTKPVEWLLGGLLSSDINLISDIKGFGVKDNEGIILGTWWRSGTNGADFWRINEEFEDFPGIMRRVLKNYNVELVSCLYRGGYEDDQADIIERQEFYRKQCNTCVIKELKNISKEKYQMTMQNGLKYSCEIANGKWLVRGWIFGTTYDTIDELEKEFISQCKSTYCRY
jgi:hypothetical protein